MEAVKGIIDQYCFCKISIAIWSSNSE
jgi:hypothetical protein